MPLQGDVDLRKLRKILNKDLIGVYSSGLQAMVIEGPADTGESRNNWFLSKNEPVSSDLRRGDDKNGGGSIASISNAMPKDVLGKELYFTNTAPQTYVAEYGLYPDPVKKGSYDKESKSYVKLSQGGFSLQTPNGWVRKALTKMARKIASL